MSGTVLITGAAKGLGFFLCEVFRESGWTVFAGHREMSSALAAFAASDAAVHPVPLDVTDPEGVRAAARVVAGRVSALDVLLNNAAILPQAGRGRIDQVDIEVGQRVFDVNALGPLRVTQAFLPLLERGQRRLLVNVSSEAGSIGECWRHDDYLYCMSKAALNMQTVLLRNALAESRISLLAVHPGWMRTSMGGPNAALDPRDSARALRSLVEAPRAADAPIFVDQNGQALAW
ncbi:MAG: SDR family oxidoreductase [Polyangiaceae bacterium]